tara:strand:- start:188 stop:541 length:354 start_codon:yes stop_codon:yes gene_type:complete
MKLTRTIPALLLGTGLALAGPAVMAHEPTLGEAAGNTAEKAGDFAADSALTAKVKVALISHRDLDAIDIEVESTDGVVTLSGEVPNQAALEQAEMVVAQLEGVKDVHNELRVVPVAS